MYTNTFLRVIHQLLREKELNTVLQNNAYFNVPFLPTEYATSKLINIWIITNNLQFRLQSSLANSELSTAYNHHVCRLLQCETILQLFL